MAKRREATTDKVEMVAKTLTDWLRVQHKVHGECIYSGERITCAEQANNGVHPYFHGDHVKVLLRKVKASFSNRETSLL